MINLVTKLFFGNNIGYLISVFMFAFFSLPPTRMILKLSRNGFRGSNFELLLKGFPFFNDTISF
jgi:hypothetical protein